MANFTWDIVGCAKEGCDLPAESAPLSWAPGLTGGYIVHTRIACIVGHVVYSDQPASTGR